jgi:hypothetical protein
MAKNNSNIFLLSNSFVSMSCDVVMTIIIRRNGN